MSRSSTSKLASDEVNVCALTLRNSELLAWEELESVILRRNCCIEDQGLDLHVKSNKIITIADACIQDPNVLVVSLCP